MPEIPVYSELASIYGLPGELLIKLQEYTVTSPPARLSDILYSSWGTGVSVYAPY